jgi:hypothetical protein
MYKPIWDLVFKCNGSGIQFNTIQSSQEYSNQRNMRKEKKWSNKNTKCNGVRLKNAYVSGTLNLQQLRLSRNTKNSFTLVELGPLHKNGLPSLSVTRVSTHSKGEWQHTQKQEMSDNTLKNVSTITQKGLSTIAQENVYKKITKDQVGRIERN